MAALAQQWLAAHEEDHVGAAAELNQYWYSSTTIATLTGVVRAHVLRTPPAARAARLDCAFLSTPSLFFALGEEERSGCRCLDYDETLGKDEPGFVRYDFRRPLELPPELHGAFECVVIDPPFITSDVWRQYAQTAGLLLREGGRVVLTTVIENAPLLRSLLGVRPTLFLPSIPNLPYQYATFANFQAPELTAANPEVPHDPHAFLASTAGAEPPAREAERPISGAGSSYDFEEMVLRAEQEDAARRAATGAS
jgi:hypothetical protein